MEISKSEAFVSLGHSDQTLSKFMVLLTIGHFLSYKTDINGRNIGKYTVLSRQQRNKILTTSNVSIPQDHNLIPCA